MGESCLITGANGHLGNNLVRSLAENGKQVRAGVRRMDNLNIFVNVDCEVVYTDILDKDSLEKAMQGIDVLYHCAAVFKHWAKDPVKDIVQANLDGTRNVLEVASKQGVKKIIYVSSIVALDRNNLPMNESGWNSDFSSPYNHAKTVSEQLAWELAEKLDIWMISVLPAAMVGPHVYRQMTPAMSLLNSILGNTSRLDIGFVQNFVDVRDVVSGMQEADYRGKRGSRYILGNEHPLSTTSIFEIARDLFGDIRKPPLATKEYLMQFAAGEEAKSLITGQEPSLTTYDVELMYGADTRLDISAARNALNFAPRSPEDAVKDALLYLYKANSDIAR
jgi:dihydroflavonol-4-reductase